MNKFKAAQRYVCITSSLSQKRVFVTLNARTYTPLTLIYPWTQFIWEQMQHLWPAPPTHFHGGYRTSQASTEWLQLPAQQIQPARVSCVLMCSSARCSNSAAALQLIEMSLPLAEGKRSPTKPTFLRVARAIFSPCTHVAILHISLYSWGCSLCIPHPQDVPFAG